MTLKEKLELFKEKGWTYNKETGEVFSHTGKIKNTTNYLGYIQCGLIVDTKSVKVQAHQLAWYLSTGNVPNTIDHINRIKNDNRFINLRNVTIQENTFNTNAKGYCWSKSKKKFRSNICISGKLKFLGYYNTEEEARKAYLDAKKIYHLIN